MTATMDALSVNGCTTVRRAFPWQFLTFLLVLFIAAASATILYSRSMAAMDEMPMPGGWTMSMMWMRMAGQSRFGAVGNFISMWLVMMIAMMLPSVAPALSRYRRALGCRAEASLNRLTALVGVAYFLVWAVVGMVAFPLGFAVAVTQMHRPALARFAPLAVAGILIVSGVVQFTAWKAQQLRYCAHSAAGFQATPANTMNALRHGLRLGLRCWLCCANLTSVFLVIGMMDLRVMGVTTLAIGIERIAPIGRLAVRVTGALLIGVGLLLGARAVALR